MRLRDNLLPFEKLNTPTLNLDLGKGSQKSPYRAWLRLLFLQMNALEVFLEVLEDCKIDDVLPEHDELPDVNPLAV